jgi:hypothetical protein
MDRKGLELSMTIIVLLIISVIVFIGSITLVWKLFAGAEEIKAGIDLQTKNQIEALLRSGNELVTIPVNTQQASVGQEKAFGLGIRNIAEDERGYYVLLGFSNIYDRAGKPLSGADKEYVESRWLGNFISEGPIYIARNKYEIVPLRVRTDTRIGENQPTPKGSIVVFNVCVFDTPLQDQTVCNADARSVVYDKIKQVFIEIK